MDFSADKPTALQKVTDRALLDIYEEAKKSGVSPEFIELIERELRKRGLLPGR